MEWIKVIQPWFMAGGTVMYVLCVCSLVVVFLGCERYLVFARLDSGHMFAVRFYHVMMRRQYKEAVDMARETRGALARMIMVAAQMETVAQRQAYIELETGRVLTLLQERLYYISLIVTAAPLLGLLGTIHGMMYSFQLLSTGGEHALVVTGGVSEALVATSFGIIIALVAMVMHTYFRQRHDRIIGDIELCFSAWEWYQKEG